MNPRVDYPVDVPVNLIQPSPARQYLFGLALSRIRMTRLTCEYVAGMGQTPSAS